MASELGNWGTGHHRLAELPSGDAADAHASPDAQAHRLGLTPPAPDTSALLAASRRVAREVLRVWAPVVDRDNRFPTESIAALRAAGLLAYFIPQHLGGAGGDVLTFCSIASALGEECLSTALIWVMHCQQHAILTDESFPERDDILASIAREGHLVASVTTDIEGSSDVLQPRTALSSAAGEVRLVRTAPIVSYGREAAFYLVTMRRGDGQADPVMVLVDPSAGTIEVTGEWQAMGMRGTQSVPMRFDVRIEPGRILQGVFRDLAIRTIIPLGHIGWAAAWLGAAKGAFTRTLMHLRAPGGRRLADPRFEALRERLAALRLSLDLGNALLTSVANRVHGMRLGGEPAGSYSDVTFTIQVNNLKIAAAQLSFATVHGLIDICGLHHGYCEPSELALERVFRDLRSASLMYSDQRLLSANGSLLFVEGSSLMRSLSPRDR